MTCLMKNGSISRRCEIILTNSEDYVLLIFLLMLFPIKIKDNLSESDWGLAHFLCEAITPLAIKKIPNDTQLQILVYANDHHQLMWACADVFCNGSQNI